MVSKPHFFRGGRGLSPLKRGELLESKEGYKRKFFAKKRGFLGTNFYQITNFLPSILDFLSE